MSTRGMALPSFSGDAPEVFTLSVHGANNYPFRKEPSDLDLELPDGAGDEPFLEVVREGVGTALSSIGLRPGLFPGRGRSLRRGSPGTLGRVQGRP